MPDPAAAAVIVQLVALAAAGLVGCYVAERLGTGRIVGGVVAGLIIGPTLLGNLAPDAHRRLWQGALDEHRALLQKHADMRSAIEAAEASGVTGVYVDELRDRFTREIADAERVRDDAEAEYRRTTDGIALAAMLALLLAAGRAAPLRHVGAHAAKAVPMALATVLVPTLGAFACSWLFGPLGRGPDDAVADPMKWTLGLALGVSAAAIPIAARLIDRIHTPGFHDDADRVVPMLRCAGALNGLLVFAALSVLLGMERSDLAWSAATGLTLTVIIVGALAAVALAVGGMKLLRDGRSESPSWSAGWLFVVALGPAVGAAVFGLPLALGALVGGLAVGSLTHTPPLLRRGLGQLADAVALPVLCAYIGTRIDLVPMFDWVWILVALVLFGDGKATGALLVERLMGGAADRRWGGALRVGCILAAGGALPLIVATLTWWGGLIDDRLLTALVCANVITAALAGPMLRMLDRAEREADEAAA